MGCNSSTPRKLDVESYVVPEFDEFDNILLANILRKLKAGKGLLDYYEDYTKVDSKIKAVYYNGGSLEDKCKVGEIYAYIAGSDEMKQSNVDLNDFVDTMSPSEKPKLNYELNKKIANMYPEFTRLYGKDMARKFL
tara:strand:- start:154 stop:561 length:408 start_codon:yes stop_codon:yes gene_type:complete